MWELRDTLHDIESAYGVPKEILVAVWGLESDFGAFSGDFPVLESLLHLAYLSDDAARGAFFRDEALCALQIVERGVARAQARGRYRCRSSPARVPQLMPTAPLWLRGCRPTSLLGSSSPCTPLDTNPSISLCAGPRGVLGRRHGAVPVHAVGIPALRGGP